jgi:[ribosomal protein S18]-alanine N-acetyltransferase
MGIHSQISIRCATRWDIRQVLKIDRLAFAQQWNYETFERALKDVFLVCEEKKILRTILGFVVARHSEGAESAMILKVAMHPHHRKKGIGTRLIQAALDELAKMHVRTVDLHVHPSNPGAIRLYERFGFTVVRMERPHYGEDQDFYLMRLQLGYVV